MNFLTGIGLVAATLTTVSFLPQVLKIWRTKSAKDLSTGMFLTFFSGVVLWLVYGSLINDLPVILANGVTLALTLIIIVLKIRYK